MSVDFFGHIFGVVGEILGTLNFFATCRADSVLNFLRDPSNIDNTQSLISQSVQYFNILTGDELSIGRYIITIQEFFKTGAFGVVVGFLWRNSFGILISIFMGLLTISVPVLEFGSTIFTNFMPLGNLPFWLFIVYISFIISLLTVFLNFLKRLLFL